MMRVSQPGAHRSEVSQSRLASLPKKQNPSTKREPTRLPASTALSAGQVASRAGLGLCPWWAAPPERPWLWPPLALLTDAARPRIRLGRAQGPSPGALSRQGP